ncbi:MAG: hypothetical protein JSS60_02260 [Verrucomicrobia bacterium]|nr:hypothetical protein [Verrucomicrobiota bacterium]
MASKLESVNSGPLLQMKFLPDQGPRNIEQELQIDAAARQIISAPMPSAERRLLLSELLRRRAELLTHVPVQGLKGTVVFFNVQQIGLPPTPLCPAYNKMRLPTISSYHTIGSNIASIRLDPSALPHVPKEVLEKAGDLSGKQVDLFWTAIDGRPFANLQRPINLDTHPWSHPHALPGHDVKYDVNMGIFPEVGFKKSNWGGSLEMGTISPMQVHTHGHPKNMLYSPDNAHFEVIPDSPFGILWTVSQKDNRIAFTKMLVVFDYAHPVCRSIDRTIRGCNDLDTHVTHLEGIKKGIHETFGPLIELFEQNDPHAMEEFNKLPLAFQHGIFKETWIMKDSPRGIHGDFGKASFMNEGSLDVKHHCDAAARAEAVKRYAMSLGHLLCDSQRELLLNSQSLVKGDNVLKMMRCAQLIDNKQDKEAMELFQTFSQNEQEAVFFAIWELSDCPRGNPNFGRDAFLSQATFWEMKKDALLFAASRQTPQFDRPLIEAPELPQELEKIEIPQAVITPNIDSSTPVIPGETTETSTPVVVSDTQVSTFNSSTTTSDLIANNEEPLTPPQVLDALIEMAFDSDFALLSKEEQKARIRGLFENLPVSLKNNVYGRIYDNSIDPHKGGPSWAEIHVADDLNVLILSLQELLG